MQRLGSVSPVLDLTTKIPFGQIQLEGELSVPGDTHLFEERGTLEEVARLAADWFQRKLSANVA